jgi:hypothetical protein
MTAVTKLTAEQTHVLSLRSLMTRDGWRNYVRYEIRREKDGGECSNHHCQCGRPCQRLMCIRCWQRMLEVEP